MIPNQRKEERKKERKEERKEGRKGRKKERIKWHGDHQLCSSSVPAALPSPRGGPRQIANSADFGNPRRRVRFWQMRPSMAPLLAGGFLPSSRWALEMRTPDPKWMEFKRCAFALLLRIQPVRGAQRKKADTASPQPRR